MAGPPLPERSWKDTMTNAMLSFQEIKARLDLTLKVMIVSGLDQPSQFDQLNFWVQYTPETDTHDVVVVYDHKNDCESDILVYRNGKLAMRLGYDNLPHGVDEWLKDKFFDDVMANTVRFNAGEYSL